MKNWIKKRFGFLANESDIKFLLINARYKMFYQLSLVIFGFFTTWCFANFTSISFYGTFLQILSLITFFSFLSFAGINQSLIQSVANGYDYFLITSLKKIFKFSISGTLALFLFAIFYSLLIEFNYIILVCIFISAIFFPFNSILITYTYFLDGKGEFRKSLIFQLLNLLVTNSLIFLLIFITKNLILHFFLLYSIQLIINLLIIKKCINMIENKEKIIEKDKEALNYGFFFTKYGFLRLISININNVIIGFFYGPEELAFYIIGTGLIIYLINFIKPFFSVLLTKYSKESSKISKKFLYLIIIGSVLLFLFVIYIVLPIYLQIFFPLYINSITYGIFYSFLLIIDPLAIIIGYYFRARIERRVVGVALFSSNILFLIFTFPFLIIFGIYGLIFNEFLRVFIMLLIYLLNIKKIDFS